MIVRRYTDVKTEAINAEGAKGVAKRVLISRSDGAPNFIMRQFTIEPGGNTPYHTHDWEHEVYVLSGKGRVRQSDSVCDLSAGSVVLVLPNEEHGFINSGVEPLVFLCSVPK
ncbi:MAG: cupin domain-containing protein [Candidatus Sabulitectum sp.]|nr:cupin domain-containing protein [Candidatus Sabulitectum sp.]